MPFYKVSKKCRLCLSKNIKTGLKLKKIPIGEKYFLSQKKAKTQKKIPLTISWCAHCKNVQLNEVINSKNLWNNYTYFSSQTKAILDHFNDVSKIILKRFNLDKNDLVFDIGSNDGSLLNYFKKQKIKVLGIDPAANVVKFANEKGIKTIKGIFDYKISKLICKKYKKAKIITAFNVFAHTENIRGMLRGIKNLLSDDGIFIFEVQYLKDIYKNKILGTFFHEHMYHHSVTSLNKLLQSFDMTLFDIKKVNIQKGSIIGFVSKKKRKVSNEMKKMLIDEKLNKFTNYNKLLNFQRFINFQQKKSKKILSKYKNKVVAGYGSARSGPSLACNFGIDKDLKYLFDDHKLKVSKFSSLNGLKVLPTKFINILNPKLSIILAYLHSKKIIKKNIKYLQNGGNFMLIFPTPHLINLKNYKKFIN